MSEKDHQKQASDENGLVNMVEKLTQALIDLQTQVLFMEDTLDKLDNIVTGQSQLIADQQRQLQLLYQKLETQTQGSQIQPFDLLSDKPPHY
ncbi:SlyX protein [Moraxella osloensis]|uniref:SlyX protein n=1 Tax=Faucicola osloensis TaxID=34062 RepID=A0AAW6T856_FAUOS|nr:MULTISPECIES: SlyX family protein [Moraxella]MDI4508818.1 SlyX protein [Moraxella osloensis]WNP26648.1 SlyX family protein [Moraxella sp. DOX410]